MSSVVIATDIRSNNWDWRAELACVSMLRQSVERRRREAELQADVRMFASLDEGDLLALRGLMNGSVGMQTADLSILRARWGLYPDIFREEIANSRHR